MTAPQSAMWNLPWAWDAMTVETTTSIGEARGENRTPAVRIQQEKQRVKNREGRPDLFELPPNKVWQWPQPTDDVLVSFRMLLDVLDELSCEVVFVQMPLMPGFAEANMPAVSQRFLEDIVPAIEARGYSFFDLQGAPYPTEPEQFFSLTHVNRAGCLVTSEVFARHVIAPILRGATPKKRQR